MKPHLSLLLATSLALITIRSSTAGTEWTAQPQDDIVVQERSALYEWWHGRYLTGDWFGARDTLEDYGLTVNGRYYGALFGVVASEGGSRAFWDQGLQFDARQNIGRLLQSDALEGVRLFGTVRWRDRSGYSNPNEFVQANSMFNPTNWNSGVGWRLLRFGIELSSTSFLPVEDMIFIRAGWLQPQTEFADQPLSKLFYNNAVNSAKGIGGNIPYSSSLSTWGGTIQIKPTDWAYVKGGLFMAYPQATAEGNRGLAFSGFAQDLSQNGLLGMVESGLTPKIGPAELPGKYAMGAYYWGNDRASFFGADYGEQWGLYWQADQMLYREPSPASEEPLPSGKGSGKSFTAPVSSTPPKLSKQGLSTFNLISFAPKYNNPFPFYFQSGLVYRGLIPGRDEDQTLFSIAFGNYSYYDLLADRSAGRPESTYTAFLEWGYRIQVNQWAFLQPFAQYVVRPNGTSNVGNAAILGFGTGVDF